MADKAHKPLLKPTIGRPSTYEPRFCDEVVQCGLQGYSFAQIARHLGTTRSSLYDWAERHPSFSSALVQARDYALAWWEDQGMKGMWAGKEFNDRVLKMSLVNRFPQDYRERVEVSGALAKINWDALSDEQLARIAGGEHPWAVLSPPREVEVQPHVLPAEESPVHRAEESAVHGAGGEHGGDRPGSQLLIGSGAQLDTESPGQGEPDRGE